MKTTKINLNLYKTFVEVYETKNLSNAAINLGLTQPTISYNIKELEKQLKTRLFNSNSRGVEPTANADELYPIVRQAFTYLVSVEDTIQEFSQKSNGVIRLHLSLYYMTQITSDFISNFNRQYPNIRFEITIAKIDDAIESLKKHEADLLICAYSPSTLSDHQFETIILRDLENCFFASKGFTSIHGLDTKITKAQFEKLPVIAHPKCYQARTELERIGIAKTPIIEANTTEMIISLAEKDLGIAFGPVELVASNTALVKLDIADVKFPKFSVAIKYNKNLANKAAVALINNIKNKYNKN